jgi:hypothetical protein
MRGMKFGDRVGVFVVGLTCHVMMTVWFMVMITSPGCAVC